MGVVLLGVVVGVVLGGVVGVALSFFLLGRGCGQGLDGAPLGTLAMGHPLNYFPLPPQSSRMEHRITSVCPLDKQLWVGTGTASVHIFSVSSRVADPEDSIMQLAQHSEEDPMSKSLCAYVHPSRQEGLVGGETTEREGSPAPSPTLNFDRSITDNRPRQLPYRFHRRNAFGRTFHREIRREHSSEARKEQEVYQLNHITSSKVMLAEPSDSPRVIGICPIRYALQTHTLPPSPLDLLVLPAFLSSTTRQKVDGAAVCGNVRQLQLLQRKGHEALAVQRV